MNTDLGCDYLTFFQTTVQYALIGSQLIWQFVSAALTDKTETWAQYFMLITLVLQTGCDVAIYFFSTNKWWVLGYVVFRFTLVNQISNSIAKIFKMRMELVLEMTPEEQMNAFNVLSVVADFSGRIMVVVGIYMVVLIMAWQKVLTFRFLLNMMMIAMLIWDVISLVANLFIRTSYFLPADEEPSSDVPSDGNLVGIGNYEPAVAMAAVADDEDISRHRKSARVRSQLYFSGDDSFADNLPPMDAEPSDADVPLIQSGLGLSGLIENVQPDPTMVIGEDNMTVWKYLVYCVKSMWYNKVLLNSMIHVWVVSALLGYVSLVLRFKVADQGADPTERTPENFCGNSLIVLIQTQVSTEVCRLGGAIIYQIYMSKLAPLWFYRLIYLIYAGIMAVMLFMVIFPLGATVGSVVLGVINVTIFLAIIYASNVFSAAMESSTAGFIFGVQGTVLQLVSLLPVATVAVQAKLPFPDEFITGFCVMMAVWSGCFSLWFSFKSAKDLNVLGPQDKPHKNKCLRCLFGY